MPSWQGAGIVSDGLRYALPTLLLCSPKYIQVYPPARLVIPACSPYFPVKQVVEV